MLQAVVEDQIGAIDEIFVGVQHFRSHYRRTADFECLLGVKSGVTPFKEARPAQDGRAAGLLVAYFAA